MKQSGIQKVIISGVFAVAILVTLISFAIAWFQVEVSTSYRFTIKANGVLYVYVEADVVDNATPLVPAVMMQGAVEQGLPYDVLTVYDPSSPTPSYVQEAAGITTIKGKFTVQNEGWAYEKVELEKDEDGYTLYPKITESGFVVWKDASDHSKGWQTMYCYTDLIDGSLIGEDGTMDGIPTHKSTKTDYAPTISPSGRIAWLKDVLPTIYQYPPNQDHGTLYYYYDSSYYEPEQHLKEGAHEALVHVDIQFKPNPDSDEQFDSAWFCIKRLYFTRRDEDIAEGVGMGAVYGNSGVELATLSSDKTSATFTMYGTEDFFVHAEVYLTQPDELLDPLLRGKDVYMKVAVSVEVTQYDDVNNGAGE